MDAAGAPAAGRLAGRRAVVTGGGRGIGRAYVERFLREGASVVIGDLDEEGAAATVEELSALGEVSAVRADVADEASVAELIGAAADRLGGLDILLNNAGLFADWDRNDHSYANLLRVFEVNLHSMWLTIRAAADHLAASPAGRVINQASDVAWSYGWWGTPGERIELDSFSYAQSKRAVVGLTKYAATQLGNWGITVNAIAPGMVQTGGLRDFPKAAQESVIAQQAIKRAMVPVDLAGTAVYLASDDAAFVTGQTIVVDGGRFMPA